jgi:rSAM-associated Gly-rich repeat protein
MAKKSAISKALALVLPAGAVGASMLLAMSSAQASQAATLSQDASADKASVAERLQAIRNGVAQAAADAGESAEIDGARLEHTWWANGGFGRWRGGWGNGGWHNWRNGWNNWGNGWNNWGNGWNNFWRNF